MVVRKDTEAGGVCEGAVGERRRLGGAFFAAAELVSLSIGLWIP